MYFIYFIRFLSTTIKNDSIQSSIYSSSHLDQSYRFTSLDYLFKHFPVHSPVYLSSTALNLFFFHHLLHSSPLSSLYFHCLSATISMNFVHNLSHAKECSTRTRNSENGSPLCHSQPEEPRSLSLSVSLSSFLSSLSSFLV